jgi:phosphate transport system substrate-binding protein
MKRNLFGLVVIACCLLASCQSTSPLNPTPFPSSTDAQTLSGHIAIAGSTTILPLMKDLSAAFASAYPNISIEVDGGGSSVGVNATAEGKVNIGMVSREINVSELAAFPDLLVYTIALDGIAIIVNHDVTINTITIDQLSAIYNGQLHTWAEVGGPDQEIILIAREEGSGTRTAFEQWVSGPDVSLPERTILLPSSSAVLTTVATTPFSIGYISFGYLDNSIKSLQINGIEPTEKNLLAAVYPIYHPLNLVTKGEPSEVEQAFFEFIASPEGQAIISQEKYVPVN